MVEGLARKAGEKFAFDSYRRFLDMYGDVVMGVDHRSFEAQIDALKREVGVATDNELSEENLRRTGSGTSPCTTTPACVSLKNRRSRCDWRPRGV